MLHVLLLIVLTSGVANLQDKLPSNPCQALTSNYDLFKYGAQWSNWNEHERSIYLTGMLDGSMIYVDFILRQPQNVQKEVFSKHSVVYDSDVLLPVITTLYQDPANVYIHYRSMLFLARDK